MKVFLLIFVVFVCITKTYCQNAKTPGLSKDYYLQKSKKQKTAAWILLGGGVGLTMAGVLINATQNTENFIGVFVGETQTHETKGLWLCAVGGAATIASIPFFISAHKNRKTAASVALGSQNIYLPLQNNVVIKKLPTVTLKLNL
jgi:hypothetical protein